VPYIFTVGFIGHSTKEKNPGLLNTLICTSHAMAAMGRPRRGGAAIIDCHRLSSILTPHIKQSGMRRNGSTALI
jgi:hypothetical protein